MAKEKPKKKREAPKHLPPPAPKGNKYALGNEGGRPREWDDAYIEKVRKALEKWIADPKNYFFTSFLNQQKLHHEHIERFCNYSAEFRATHKLALSVQEQRLVELAITKKHDGNFTKFVLANKAGWKERQEVSGDATSPLAIILDRIAGSAKDPLDYDG